MGVTATQGRGQQQQTRECARISACAFACVSRAKPSHPSPPIRLPVRGDAGSAPLSRDSASASRGAGSRRGVVDALAACPDFLPGIAVHQRVEEVRVLDEHASPRTRMPQTTALAMVRGDFDLSLAWPLGDLAGFIQRDPDAPASAPCHSARGRATWLPPSARTSPTSTQRSRRLPRLLSTHEPTSDSKPWRVGRRLIRSR